jgi:3-deoxy-D-arabino-heptulosonate 7-phosphate (DAHP) synthase
VVEVGTSKAGGTISQQAAVHPWLAADAHVNEQTNKTYGNTQMKNTHIILRPEADNINLQSNYVSKSRVLFQKQIIKIYFHKLLIWYLN